MSKKCAEFSTNESGRKYCARFENVDGDIAMAKTEDENLGYFDIGEVTKAVGALGSMGLSDIVPPLVGGLGAVLTTLLIRKFVKDPASTLNKWAPVGGILGGVLASVPLYWFYGKAGVIKGALGGAVVGGGLLAVEKLSGWGPFAGMGLINVQKMGRLGGPVAAGRGNPYILPTAKVPGGIHSAMDVGAFAGAKNSYGA